MKITRQALTLASCLTLAGLSVYSVAGVYVVGSNTKNVRLYDQQFNELEWLSSADFESQFQAFKAEGQDIQGLKVLDYDRTEEMLKVEYKGPSDSVWVERIAVEVWPAAQIDCPTTLVGSDIATDENITIGFGKGVCKQ